ncbi:MAG TPA: penicillin-binding transpeptidase domain-containing protein [Bacteroidota bacterium]|nr:penicillin-binding transpeptidase domain-containing protein [Bacteroidota bacterium]
MSSYEPAQNIAGNATPDLGHQPDRSMRLLITKIVLLFAFAVAAVRLVQIQIIDSSKYQAVARKQYEVKIVLPATRGNIYDRQGNILVSNSMFFSYAADPKIVGDGAAAVAKRFSKIFGKPEQYYLQKFDSDKRFVWLERHVSPEIAKRLQASPMEGVAELNEPKRLYHYDNIGGQVIGCTNIDNVGISGIEYSYDKDLRGVDGFVVMQRDGMGRKRPSADYPRQEPVRGHSIALTIDVGLQSIVEDELKKGVEKMKASSGLAMILDPTTGEVLAMSHVPSVNPYDVAHTDPQVLKARAVTDMYEPGSVFKIVTASAALENKLISPNQMFFAENGKYKVPLAGGRFRLITDTHESGMITFEQAMEFSSNIVMAKASDIIGAERLYKEARDYGFGMATGIELPGEADGELKKPVEWSGATLNSIAYGYEVAATPLQIAAAYCAVANGGTLMKPYIISKEMDENGNVVYAGQPEPIRRVVSKETAKTLRDFFIGVVEHGTGQSAAIPGITIAGKTGTSRQFVDGKYELGNYNATFVGFFPAEKPEFVCLVIVEDPRAGGYTAAYASAPVFKAIAQQIINNKGLLSKSTIAQQTSDDQPPTVTIPNVTHIQREAAAEILESSGFRVNASGNGNIVLQQVPEAGTKLQRGETVQLIVNESTDTLGSGSLSAPNLCGMSLRRAINRLTAENFDAAVIGSGIVVRQMPAASAAVQRGAKILLICEPKPITSAQLY